MNDDFDMRQAVSRMVDAGAPGAQVSVHEVRARVRRVLLAKRAGAGVATLAAVAAIAVGGPFLLPTGDNSVVNPASTTETTTQDPQRDSSESATQPTPTNEPSLAPTSGDPTASPTANVSAAPWQLCGTTLDAYLNSLPAKQDFAFSLAGTNTMTNGIWSWNLLALSDLAPDVASVWVRDISIVATFDGTVVGVAAPSGTTDVQLPVYKPDNAEDDWYSDTAELLDCGPQDGTPLPADDSRAMGTFEVYALGMMHPDATPEPVEEQPFISNPVTVTVE
jgi:hypothetical protein